MTVAQWPPPCPKLQRPLISCVQARLSAWYSHTHLTYSNLPPEHAVQGG